MIVIKGLDTKLLTLSGIQIADLTGQAPMTFKSAFITCLEMMKPNPGSGDGLKAIDIGIKIQKAKDSIDLETAEFDFLLKAINTSSVFTAIVQGQLEKKLEELKVA